MPRAEPGIIIEFSPARSQTSDVDMTEDNFRPYTPENEGPPDFLVALELSPPVTAEDVEEAYRAKAQEMHPDSGGSTEAFQELQTAYEQAKEYAVFHASRRSWLAKQVEPYMRQQQVVQELKSRGAVVEIVEFDWLIRSFGEGFATLTDKVDGLKLNSPQFGDDDLKYLAEHEDELSSVRMLELSGSSITDASLPLIAKLRNLVALDLSRTAADESVLDLVKELPELRKLNITDSQIGLWHRARLKLLGGELEVID